MNASTATQPLAQSPSRAQDAAWEGLAHALKAALAAQDMGRLESQLQTTGLAVACSVEFIEHCRALRHDDLVLMLCTLGVENGVNPQHCSLLLALYQSRSGRVMPAALDRLPHHHVLRFAALSCNPALTPSHRTTPVPSADRLCGSAAHLGLAVEFLIDQHRAGRAAELVIEVWKRGSLDELKVSLLRCLARRHRLRAPGTAECRELLPALQWIHTRISGLRASPALCDDVALLTAEVAAGAGDSDAALSAAARVRAPLQQIRARFLCTELHCRAQDIAAAIAAMDGVLQLVGRVGVVQARQVIHAPGGNQASDRSFNAAAAAAALADLCAALEPAGMSPFLVSGTLLGCARQGSFLAHDKDIDVGLLHEGGVQPVQELLQAQGRFKVSVDEHPGQPTHNLLAVHGPTGMAVDVFLYRKTAAGLVTGVRNGMGHLQTFVFTPFELQRVRFEGVDVCIPADFDRNLTENFGPWRTPDPGYLPHVESPSIAEPLGPVHMLVARLELLYALLQEKPAKVRRLFDFFSRHAGVKHALSAGVLAGLGHGVESSPPAPSPARDAQNGAPCLPRISTETCP